MLAAGGLVGRFDDADPIRIVKPAKLAAPELGETENRMMLENVPVCQAMKWTV